MILLPAFVFQLSIVALHGTSRFFRDNCTFSTLLIIFFVQFFLMLLCCKTDKIKWGTKEVISK